MDNIFKGTKFGDKFLTRDGRVAILVHIPSIPEECCYLLAVDDNDMHYVCINAFVNGTAQRAYFSEKDDIVSRYKEPIDNGKLNKLEQEYEESLSQDYYWNEDCDDGEGIHGVCSVCEIEKAFKAGYRKANEV